MAATVTPADAADAAGPVGAPGLIEQTLDGDLRWLRFPAALESRFQADTLEPRRQLLRWGTLVALLGIGLASVRDGPLLPDIADQATQLIRIYLVWVGLCWAGLLATPPHRRRNWHSDVVTAGNAFLLVAVVLWTAITSQADTATTHSAQVISPVMYACIAVRLRFVWSCGLTVAAFAAYVLSMAGDTPFQTLVIASNLRLLAVSFALVLGANYAFERSERRNWLLRQLDSQRRASLGQTAERLHGLTLRDALTGLPNRRQFDAELAAAWADAAADGQPVALLMLDVDFFKRFNDSHGHPAGDACLVRIAQALAALGAEQAAVCARLGGEEFALLLPGRSIGAALDCGDALCSAVRDAAIAHRSSEVSDRVTVSVGAAVAWPRDGGLAASLLADADSALYLAKAGGRDRTCAAPTAAVQAAHRRPATQPPQRPLAELSAGTAAAPATASADASALASAAGAGAAGAADASETAEERCLRGGFRWLCFPAAVEQSFQARHALARRRHLAVAAVIGLLVFNAYTMASRPMFTDIPPDALWTLAALSLGFAVLATASYALPLGPRWREGLHSASFSALTAGSAWALAQSQQTTVLSHVVSLVLMPLFCGIAARQPFWFVLPPALTTVIAPALLFHPATPQQALIFGETLFMIVNGTAYTLIAAYTLEHGARKAWLLGQIARGQRVALTAAAQRLQQLSAIDPLTGIGNRRQFDTDLAQFWALSQRDASALALLIIDVDHFKRYNDGYGHPAGDRCLVAVAAALARVARAHQGCCARIGGEEFAILLPYSGLSRAAEVGALACAEVVRADLPHRHSDTAARVTVSAGAASLVAAPGMDKRLLLESADQALYRAKTAGRNRVATAGD